MKPTGGSKKAFDAGYNAYLKGKAFTSNPHQYGPKVLYSSWWEAGFNKAKEEHKK